MTKETDAKIEELQSRVEDLEKTVALMIASTPVWIGYEESDERFMEDWYRKVRKEQKIRTRGIRD